MDIVITIILGILGVFAVCLLIALVLGIASEMCCDCENADYEDDDDGD